MAFFRNFSIPLFFIFAACSSSFIQAQTNASDELFLRAYNAANQPPFITKTVTKRSKRGKPYKVDITVPTNGKADLIQLAPLLSDHELAQYVDYWQIKDRIKELDPGFVYKKISSWDGSYLGNQLRGDWLKWLGIRNAWSEFDKEYAKLVSPSLEIRCLSLQSRLAQIADAAAYKQTMSEIYTVWTTTTNTPETCLQVFNTAVSNNQIAVTDIWQRARRQIETNRISDVATTLDFLSGQEAPGDVQKKNALNKAGVFLRQLPSGWENKRSNRELAILAIQRIARSDPRQAANDLVQIAGKLKTTEAGWAWGEIGWQAILRHLPEAMDWYQRSDNTQLSDEVLEWKVRAALRVGNWREVAKTIEAMPAELAEKPEWVYWQGRAWAIGGNQQQAEALYGRISGQPNFYSNLADEELGKKITFPPIARFSSKEELNQIKNNPSIQRSLIFYRLGLRLEGIREWNWGLRGYSDRELLAAATYANQNNIYDRTIYSADRTKDEHNYSLRYLTPFYDEIKLAAGQQGLDQAWVFGLIRQESRFITNARSSASASGLMQLMPNTARWVARKIGVESYSQTRINDPNLNLTLGTSYLRMVYESLDNHPILASAAYNAGPGRARKWRPQTPLEGAIYAETIPFDETRDYVKKVMCNTVYYAALAQKQPQSMKDRLGVITPQDWNKTADSEDLP